MNPQNAQTSSYADLMMSRIKKAVVADDSRKRLLFIALNVALSLTSFVMTVVNHFTGERTLMIATMAFSLLCLLNVLLIFFTNAAERALYLLFAFEAMALLAFFLISGIPDGFSSLWICLVPSFAMLIFGIRSGSIFSALAELVLIFLFWTPVGKSLLRHEYSTTFMLRFPLLYASMFVIAAIIEYVRRETQNQLERARAEYEHLYRHDALTGLYNRYGMQEYFDNVLTGKDDQKVAVIMFDIDNFKRVNDTWGHECGDLVLKTVGSVPARVMCEHSHFCRWGGEEFLLLMQCEHVAAETAEKVREAIEKTEIRYGDEILHVTVSLGVGVADPGTVSKDNIHALIELADEAMYESKKNGKNRVTVAYMKEKP